MPRSLDRRAFLAALGAGAAGIACSHAQGAPAARTAVLPGVARDEEGALETPSGAAGRSTETPAAAATPTPRPVRPQAAYERAWLSGTRWETPVSIRDSGVAGETVMVLGGVHGNEPGGWMAAEAVRDWIPEAGSLIVAPQLNRLAIAGFVRTFDELGDLNRLYPGDAGSALPMERMAAEIVATANEFGASLLLDMHESWAFWVDAPGTGTAALGQTVTAGIGPRAGVGKEIADALNGTLPTRDRLVVRDGTTFRRPEGGSGAAPGTGRGRSSLSLGGWVPGLTPVLVEMGQQGQPVERRVQLHLAIARTALSMNGVLSA